MTTETPVHEPDTSLVAALWRCGCNGKDLVLRNPAGNLDLNEVDKMTEIAPGQYYLIM
jgi:hypothetical protein